MSARPLVSIIMPMHNAAATVEEAVRSVQAQTLKDWELLVWDDASTDGGRGLLEAMDEPRLFLLGSEDKIGPGLARNRAMASARGHWIAFLDADDCWLRNRLETLLKATGNRHDLLIFDDIMICHSDTDFRLVPWKRLRGQRAFGFSSSKPRDVQLSDFIRSERLLMQPMFPAHCIRNAKVQHTSRQFAEDIEFVLKLAAAGLCLRYVPEPLYLYRVTPGSATAQTSDLTLMRRCIEDAQKIADWPEETRIAFTDKIRSLQRNEALYMLHDAWKSRTPQKALQALARTPAVLIILPKRLIRLLYYHIHRLFHGGKKR